MEDSFTKVIMNSLLMQIITSDWSFHEILKLRNVCSQFNNSITSFLRPHVALRILPQAHSNNLRETKTLKFLQTFRNTPHDWRMKICAKGFNNEESPMMFHLLEEFGLFIHTLELDISTWTAARVSGIHRHVPNFKQLLKKMTGIEVLNITISNRGQHPHNLRSIKSTMDEILQGEDSVILPRLRKLIWNEKVESRNPHLLHKSFPSLEVLKIGCVLMEDDQLTQNPSIEWKHLNHLTLAASWTQPIRSDFNWLTTLSPVTLPTEVTIEEVGWNSGLSSQSEKTLFSEFLNTRRNHIRSLELTRPSHIPCDSPSEITEDIKSNSLLGGTFPVLKTLKCDITFIRNLKTLLELSPALDTLELLTHNKSFRHQGDIHCTKCNFHNNLWPSGETHKELGLFPNIQTLSISGQLDHKSLRKLSKMFIALNNLEIQEYEGNIQKVFKYFTTIKTLKVRPGRLGDDPCYLTDAIVTGIEALNPTTPYSLEGVSEEILTRLRGGRPFIGSLKGLEELDLSETRHCAISYHSIVSGLEYLNKLKIFKLPQDYPHIPAKLLKEYLRSLNYSYRKFL